MKSAPNLVLVGPMGSGKSSIGRRLAERLSLPFVDADREIEHRTGATIPLIFELEGETGFRAREHETLAHLCAGHGQVIASGGGAVLHPDTRALLPARSFVLYLAVDLETQLRRLANDRGRPLLQQGNRRELLQRIGEERAPIYAQLADLRYDTGRAGVRHAVEQILDLLRQHWRLTQPLPAPLDTSA